MKFDVLTLFPDLVYQYCSQSILGRAQAKNLIRVRAHSWRAFSGNKWGHVDDKPYGGGPGMILRVGPIYECLRSLQVLPQTVRRPKTEIIIMDPAGKKFDQRMAGKLSKLNRLVFIAGRYEGFDARVYKFADERVSVGDYVLAGGELAALTILEAVARLIPGVLGNPESLKEETFSKYESGIINQEKGRPNAKLLTASPLTKEYPQYTRPENFRGMKVPKILLTGDHKKIREWKKKQL